MKETPDSFLLEIKESREVVESVKILLKSTKSEEKKLCGVDKAFNSIQSILNRWDSEDSIENRSERNIKSGRNILECLLDWLVEQLPPMSQIASLSYSLYQQLWKRARNSQSKEICSEEVKKWNRNLFFGSQRTDPTRYFSTPDGMGDSGISIMSSSPSKLSVSISPNECKTKSQSHRSLFNENNKIEERSNENHRMTDEPSEPKEEPTENISAKEEMEHEELHKIFPSYSTDAYTSAMLIAQENIEDESPVKLLEPCGIQSNNICPYGFMSDLWFLMFAVFVFVLLLLMFLNLPVRPRIEIRYVNGMPPF